ncbi:exonuclease [Cylindrobasidium torrendii FP15055 ss-10]|uniref:Mitochondrial escape protein 2 n=1 Tax=Cylindrobasidium torrendii FP15055 ss-10 TaxID=1314674 RepID=A0A0D7BAY7_9AGAR|nr:exonuclease [Cylindrobasidium torrendii FP15055 ss-10]
MFKSSSGRVVARRFLTTTASAVQQSGPTASASLFIDSVFPTQIGRFDFRRYVGFFLQDSLVQKVESTLSAYKSHGFKVESIEPHQKDGGVFVKFSYVASEQVDAQTIERELQQALQRKSMPTWLGTPGGRPWLVKGGPWIEDMNRYPSSILKVSFDGPDVNEETLYRTLRPFGRIKELSPPTPGAAGLLRFSTATFSRTHSAAIARNVLHGYSIPSGTSVTTLRTSYQAPIQAHAIRDFMGKHPKIVLPVLFTLLATITYAIFDPVRTLLVQGKVEQWFDLRENEVYLWLRTNTFDRIYSTSLPHGSSGDVWKERKDAEEAIEAYLRDLPTTVAFVHGPQGSGKTTMLNSMLHGSERRVLTVDCLALLKATSDTQLVDALANQTGYWPVFSFFNSVSNLIDLASVGLIGQKAGFSSSLTEQLHDILSVTTEALSNVGSSHRRKTDKQAKKAEKAKKATPPRPSNDTTSVSEKAAAGLSENSADSDVSPPTSHHNHASPEAVSSLPIVIIKNYQLKGGPLRDETLTAIASWAATLAENRIAHVIVVSDNRENMKRIAKALPAKPLVVIGLDDADSESAMAFVQQKLKDADVNVELNANQAKVVEKLGGRASDLETLIHKIRSGLTVEDAVEDIINRGVGEIQKSAFGDDAEDAKNLPWTRQQAWAVLRKLAKSPEISYSELLLDFPFKGDEQPLRNMEQAELISMGTEKSGRPSTVRPGKPIYRSVFQRLVQDPGFQASQDLAFNEKIIASSDATVKSCEDELSRLRDMGADSGWTGTFGVGVLSSRMNYLLEKMKDAQAKIEKLEKDNKGLKKVLMSVDVRASK